MGYSPDTRECVISSLLHGKIPAIYYKQVLGDRLVQPRRILIEVVAYLLRSWKLRMLRGET
jgi:hypothetical protein